MESLSRPCRDAQVRRVQMHLQAREEADVSKRNGINAKPGRPRTTRDADNHAPIELPTWLQQVKQLTYAEQENLLCAMLTQLQHTAPTAYLATLTVIESLTLREVQQRALDMQRSLR
jgi:hypothetical protein